MLAYQSIYFLGVEGMLDNNLNLAMSSALEAATPAPGFAWYWRQRSGHFTQEFQGFIDQIVAVQPKAGAEIYQSPKLDIHSSTAPAIVT
jgi:hypothetical protein